MKIFELYTHPVLGTQAVKRGWSWPGFFFSGIWALIKRLWIPGVALLVLFLGLAFFEQSITRQGNQGISLLISIIMFAANLFVGAKGNAWRSANLESRGFQLIQQVEAENTEAALAMRPFQP